MTACAVAEGQREHKAGVGPCPQISPPHTPESVPSASQLFLSTRRLSQLRTRRVVCERKGRRDAFRIPPLERNSPETASCHGLHMECLRVKRCLNSHYRAPIHQRARRRADTKASPSRRDAIKGRHLKLVKWRPIILVRLPIIPPQ